MVPALMFPGIVHLRAAIQEANALAGADTINLPAGIYTLAISGTGEDDAATGDLDINGPLTISGADMASTIIDGAGIDRIFHITGNYVVVFSGITIQNGSAPGVGLDGTGAGIFSNGTLSLNQCTIRNNTASNSGGGIYHGGSLTLNSSRITGNRASVGGGISGLGFSAVQSIIANNMATSYGGGLHIAFGNTGIQSSSIADNKAPYAGGIYIYPYTTVTLAESTISGNIATNEGFGTFSSNAGGGIYNSGSLSLTASTLSTNAAGQTTGSNDFGQGGGIYNFSADQNQPASVTLTNTTISGNVALNYGGGLSIHSGSVTMNNVTITNNSADTRNAGTGNGGGIDNGAFSGGGLINLKNTIIAGNFDLTGEAPDCTSGQALTSQGYNLLGNNSGCTFASSTGDQVGTVSSPINPLLGPLGNNGGSTRTHSLVVGSPAIDAGNPAVVGSGGDACAAVDQRGGARPLDGNNDLNAVCDIGAVEVSLANISDLSVIKTASRNAVPVNESMTYTLTITNNGPFTAAGVELTDTLPAGSVFTSADSTQGACIEASGIVNCTIGDVINGETVIVTIDITVPGTNGIILNAAEVSCSCNDPDLLNNIASVETVITIVLPRTGQTTCYDQNGVVTDCLLTGQDGDIKAGVGWPEPRFQTGTGLEGDCISDNLTGLLWAKNGNLPNGTTTWQGALDYVNTLNSGAGLCGHHDWRLPNINELQGLFNFQAGDISSWLVSQGFTNVIGAYWSSTTVALDPGTAWRSLAGVPKSSNSKAAFNYLLPVRGDSTVPARAWNTGQENCYTASGEYLACTGTGQDGELQKGAGWPDPRFTDLGDGTVMDKLTGLIWLKDANCFGNLSWLPALNKVTDFNTNPGNYSCQNYTGSFSDWRMPNIIELQSLIDHSLPLVGAPLSANALPFGHPFVHVPGYTNYFPFVWSSTSNASPYFIGDAWALGLRHGSFLTESKTSPVFNTYLWPVRGGVVPDREPPVGSIFINNNVPYINSTDVTLSPNATDPGSVTEMCISDTNSCVTWEPFTTLKPWTLPAGDGLKTVNVWFRDGLGNMNTAPFSDSITLDMTAPVDGMLNAAPRHQKVSLTWSGFSDALSGIGSYRLVYSETGTPTSCSSGTVIYSGTATAFLHTPLTNGIPLYYRVCAVDLAGNTSTGATASGTPFPDNDQDGVSNQTESGPTGLDPNYDGNGDGLPDSQQANVTSLPTFNGLDYVTLAAANETTLANILAKTNPSPGDSPAGMTFPYGFFDFTINGVTLGGATTLTLFLPSGAAPNTYYKFGATPDNPTPHWYEFLYDGQTGAVIMGNVIALHFVDGLRGDDDLTADGIIIDQGGPGLKQVDHKVYLPLIKR